MRIPITEMSREQLLAELPKRMVVLAAFVAAMGIVIGSIAVVTMQSGYHPAPVIVLVVVFLTSPLALGRVSRWMLQPAEERVRRRRAAVAKALKECSILPDGDSSV